jgi:hypothetical protein
MPSCHAREREMLLCVAVELSRLQATSHSFSEETPEGAKERNCDGNNSFTQLFSTRHAFAKQVFYVSLSSFRKEKMHKHLRASAVRLAYCMQLD